MLDLLDIVCALTMVLLALVYADACERLKRLR